MYWEKLFSLRMPIGWNSQIFFRASCFQLRQKERSAILLSLAYEDCFHQTSLFCPLLSGRGSLLQQFSLREIMTKRSWAESCFLWCPYSGVIDAAALIARDRHRSPLPPPPHALRTPCCLLQHVSVLPTGRADLTPIRHVQRNPDEREYLERIVGMFG